MGLQISIITQLDQRTRKARVDGSSMEPGPARLGALGAQGRAHPNAAKLLARLHNTRRRPADFSAAEYLPRTSGGRALKHRARAGAGKFSHGFFTPEQHRGTKCREWKKVYDDLFR